MATKKKLNYTTQDVFYKKIDTSHLTDSERLEVALDYNKQGFVVSISIEHMQDYGIWFNMTYDCKDNRFDDNDILGYIRGEETLYAWKPTVEQLKFLIENKSNILGSTGDYNVIVQGDTLKVGCQEISKEEAIKIAKGILKAFKAK